MPKISIIVPVYNVGQYLERCLKSIQEQTHRDLEVLLINDGSTDKSGEICDKWMARDSRFKAFHQENTGQAIARNRMLDIASGEYIAFVDSDDFIHPRMYEILLSNMLSLDAEVSICGYKKVTEYQAPSELEDSRPNGWTGKEFVEHCLLCGGGKKVWVLWDKLFHRSCFEGVRMPEGRIYEDNAVVYRILYEANRIADCDAVLYFYFQNQDSTVLKRFSKKHLDWLLVPKEMALYFSQKDNDILAQRCNKMLLQELVTAYKRVCNELGDDAVRKDVRQRLLDVYKQERKKYPITVKTHPELYEALYPLRMKLYFNLQGIKNKLKR